MIDTKEKMERYKMEQWLYIMGLRETLILTAPKANRRSRKAYYKYIKYYSDRGITL